ncbi:Ig-like domain-containing protein, partial [Micromonospora musae]|uniref:Ig-like domain-containing protein n=1 Tax=Micromonospora musae TaxID=1894970 RepID=UPI0033E5C55E
DDVTATWRKDAKLTATVKPNSATGPVQFLIGEDVLCEAKLKHGVATCEVDRLPRPGKHTVRVVYGGDKKYAPSYTEFTLKVVERR